MSNMLQNNHLTEERLFTVNEHKMWQKLFEKQTSNLKNKACTIFLKNLIKMELSPVKIPTIREINIKLMSVSGWQVIPVTGLIEYELYFELLANRKFPIAMIIRQDNEENLSKDPDIFHEIFGHCTMLFSFDYAEFMQEFAKFILKVRTIDRPIFSRLIWFTTETGLIKDLDGLKIFGSSILSSFDESIYCLKSIEPIRKTFNLLDIFREPYRADILQKTYYILDSSQQLYRLLDNTQQLLELVDEARNLGEFTPNFPIIYNKYANIGHCYPIKKTPNV